MIWGSIFLEFRNGEFNAHSLIFLHACNSISHCPVLWWGMIYVSVPILLPTFSPSPHFAVYLILKSSWIMTSFRYFSGAPLSWGVCGWTIKVKLLWTRGLLRWQGTVIPSNAHSYKSHQVITALWLRKKKKGINRLSRSASQTNRLY